MPEKGSLIERIATLEYLDDGTRKDVEAVIKSVPTDQQSHEQRNAVIEACHARNRRIFPSSTARWPRKGVLNSMFDNNPMRPENPMEKYLVATTTADVEKGFADPNVCHERFIQEIAVRRPDIAKALAPEMFPEKEA